MPFSSKAEFDDALHAVRSAFTAGVTKDKKWRRRQLRRIWWMIEDNKDAMCAAAFQDFHKHPFEVITYEVRYLQDEVMSTLKHFDEWTADELPTRKDMLNFLGHTRVRKEPLGVALVIGPWNFPFTLLLQPVIAAIAAGCASIVKPSDVAQASQDLVASMIPKYLDSRAIRCITAGPEEMRYILENRFDHIFFTGSASVGRIISTAAAQHLTSVTLELGGQAPAIVCKSANIDLTAKRIAATKFMNAGQVCLTVNHVLVEPSVRAALVTRLSSYFDRFMDGDPKQEPAHYTSIINQKNYDRLERLLQSTSGTVLYGGVRDRERRFFAPTIVLVRPGDSLLSEELFGPVLPIVDATLDDALALTAAGETPLGLYAFTSNNTEKLRILDRAPSGGVTFNDCLMHAFADDAPFGGMGQSGQGYYHGHYGLLAFSHLRTYMDGPPWWLDWLMGFRWPPYTVEKTKKVSQRADPPFDRDGNVRRSGKRSAVAVAGLSALVGLACWLLKFEKLPGLPTRRLEL